MLRLLTIVIVCLPLVFALGCSREVLGAGAAGAARPSTQAGSG